VAELGCQCDERFRDERFRFACKGPLVDDEHEGKRYCVLHFPSGDKDLAAFEEAIEEKLKDKDFDFSGVYFPGNQSLASSLPKATFEGRVTFLRATFGGKADFSGATFEEVAAFSLATFEGEANFSESAFKGEADSLWANNATFKDRVSFSKSTFEGGVDFSHSTFEGRVEFDRATFEGAVEFYDCTFEEYAGFSSATFKDRASFSSATFEDYAGFLSPTFNEEASFSSATFRQWTVFEEATFKRRAYFSSVTFEEEANFSRATFEDVAFWSIQTSPSQTFLRFRAAVIEKPERFSFHSTYLRPSWFVDVDAQKFDFSDVEWFWLPNGAELKLEKEIEALESRDYKRPSSLRKLQKACRQLMNNAEENRDYPTANEFHYWSLEVLREEGWRRLGVIGILYWALSGYGERPRRAFLVLVGMGTLFAILYVMVAGSLEHVGQAFLYSLAAMVRLTGVPAMAPLTKLLQPSEPGLFQFLVTAEGILGPLQIALLALAVRRKVMR